jgi:hypothetical protein
MRPACSIALVLITAAVSEASAQEPVGTDGTAAAAHVVGVQDLAPPAAVMAVGPSLRTRIGRLFTGAVVGGWVGYFVSHVAVSDWENRSGVTSYRRTWTSGGVLLGVAAGYLLSHGGQPPAAVAPALSASRKRIERDEIERSGAADAYQLIRSIRKEWLIPRGMNSFRESARGFADFDQPLSVTAGADHILVYFDNARLGGTQHLEEIALDLVGHIEFIDGPEAVFRWGTGHVHGVILLTSLSATADRG